MPSCGVCLSVCLCVCLSVTFVDSVKMKNHIVNFFSPNRTAIKKLSFWFLNSFESGRDAQAQQEAQISQRRRAMLCVIEYYAKSLKVTRGHWK